MEKYKPKAPYKIFEIHWYNPLWWIIFILSPFLMFLIEGFKGFCNAIKEGVETLKTVDLS